MDCKSSTSHNILERILLDESAEPGKLPLSLLEDITNHFSLNHEIGRGGFAVVYKGIVGQGMVAVKKLSSTYGIHENKFLEEINCLIKAKHKNIVRFLGYCSDSQGEVQEYEGKHVMAEQRSWLLCFEYARNGSLDKHITGASSGFNWRERYRIIKGICEGLCFLHQKRILHLDLKPANVLLDGHMVPKIADFGLSRCLSEEQTRAITQTITGTLGYTDPEYLKTGQITFASDIYSLGVIIMEILAGVRWYLEDESVLESWMNRLGPSEGGMQLEQVRVCSEIGIECMNLDPKKRPVARAIMDMLDKIANVDYLGKTCTGSSLAEPHVSLPGEEFGERIGKLAAKSLQKADAKVDSEILEDVTERLGCLHLQEGQLKVGQLPLGGVQDMKERVNPYGASSSSSISMGFSKKNILYLFNRKADNNFHRKHIRTLEKSHFINIFSKQDLSPILRSRNLIGKEVYKGVVDNALVVVKKINGNVVESTQLENEVIILSQIIHKNIVWLIGFCLEMDTPILVYEFLPRGSLDDVLHSGSHVPLNLDVRLLIVAESAQGLAYLHSQARTKILHGNIKPANILLDGNFMPKISDFGLSRLIARDKLHTSSLNSDMAYLDPVYMETGLLSEKSDVYSFGVVILEIISRKKATCSDNNSLVKSFVEVQENGKKATELFDKEIAVTGNLELLGCLAEIAMECLNLDVVQRPAMTDVAERLVILNRSRGLHVQHISADYSDETDVVGLFVEQKEEGQLCGVEDTNRPGASISSSISAGFYKLYNLDIFNRKAHMNFDRNSKHILKKSHFVKIFRTEQVMSMLKGNNFIGKGAFYAVYKGVFDNALVVVKKPVDGNIAASGAFENEVIIQSQVLHKNILRPIGCCLEMNNPVLVYEFLSRGSLHGILHSGTKAPLNLDVRLTILAESAQGLAYLHSQAHSKIRHGDVKPESILFDDNFMPKITNFGTSRLITADKELDVRVSVMGDMTYTDPVYLQTGLLTEKSDVYGFGIVILEVISRKKATYTYNNSFVNSFLEVHRERKKATELFDKEIVVTGNLEILGCLAEIAADCLNLDLDRRPAMTDVAECLGKLQRYHRSQVIRQS